MSEDRLVEFGPPQKIYDRPTSRFAAEFIGAANVVPLREAQSVDGKTRARVPWGDIHFLYNTQRTPAALVIRPEDIQIAPGANGDNIWPAKVEQVVFLGAIYDCRLALGGMSLRAQFARNTALEVGQQIYIHIDERRCVPIEE
jgi:iron(III) transport system ATP-binding protein